MTLILWLIPGLVFVLLILAVFRTRRLAVEAERQVPQAGRLQPVKGGVVHFVEMGSATAPPVVLIHGLSGQLQHFTYGIAELLAPAFRVVVLDRPGCGYSERDDGSLAAPIRQAQMIDEALQKIGVEQAVVAGHSLGGAVALALALERPERCRALALLSPATQDQTAAPEAFRGLLIRTPWLRRAIGHSIAVPLAAATKNKVLSMVFAPEPYPQDFMSRGGGELGLRPKAFVTASEDITALLDGIAALSARYATELKTPGGVLFGSADVILSATAHGQSMAAHGLDCETLEGRGHMIPITAPAECADFIRRMAAKAPPRAIGSG